MNKVEKDRLKENYRKIKAAYNSLKQNIARVPSDSSENYEMRCQMMVLGIQIKDIRKQLFDDRFGRFYPTRIIENFVFGNEEEQVRGGR